MGMAPSQHALSVAESQLLMGEGKSDTPGEDGGEESECRLAAALWVSEGVLALACQSPP